MKCDKCGKEYSHKVWMVHKKICKGADVAVECEEVVEYGLLSYKELQSIYAKETGKSAVGKKKDDMLKELEDIDG